jgi:hypothetical protein
VRSGHDRRECACNATLVLCGDSWRLATLPSRCPNTGRSSSAYRTPWLFRSPPQRRNLHWYGPNPPASHHDYLFRDLSTDSCSPDIRSADRLIDDLVATGAIDRSRIYVAGWSNGAYFSELYAIARFTTPTPGGNHVASAVAYGREHTRKIAIEFVDRDRSRLRSRLRSRSVLRHERSTAGGDVTVARRLETPPAATCSFIAALSCLCARPLSFRAPKLREKRYFRFEV